MLSARTGYILLITCVFVCGCRKRKADPNTAADAGGTQAAPSRAASATAEPAYAAAPAPTAPPPENETMRFNAPQPMGMYAPVYPGDYQVQLDAYNRVLRRWLVDSSSAPRNLQEIMGTFNSPKPPQPPAGRRLVYDPKTKTVSLQ